MEKRVLKFITMSMMFLFLASIIITSIVSLDLHHTATCEEEECAICNIIHIAQVLVAQVVIIVLGAITAFLIQTILTKVHSQNNIYVNQSLVFQKVQLNA